MSSDSDYYSLALRLREHGMFVMGIGRQGTKSILVRSCNRFVYLENLSVTSATTGSAPSGTDSPGDLLWRRSYWQATRHRMKIVTAGCCWPISARAIRREYPDFDPRSYNYTNLLDILRSYPDLFEVRSNDKTPPVYWMRPISENKEQRRKVGGH